MSSTRRRQTKATIGGDYWRTWNDNVPPVRHLSSALKTDIVQVQVTVSEGHPWPPPKGSSGDIGGAFNTTRNYVTTRGGSSPRLRGNDNIGLTGSRKATEWYQGAVTAAAPASPWPAANAMSDSDMNTNGATAVARCKPTNSAANLGVTLGELLKDGLPSFTSSQTWAQRTKAAHAAGDDYLNVQFGWKPLVSDIQRFAKAVDSSYSALQQIRRDDGRLVRRNYQFPTEISSTDAVLAYNGTFPSLSNQFIATDGTQTLRRTTEVVRRKWFSGSFRYFLPDSLKGESELGELRAAAELVFGVALTPEVLWSIAPWSWAVDWFSNTGDIISNISDSQRYGLIMPHGYLMVHTISKNTFSVTGSKFKNSGGIPSPISFVTETKQRAKANPFGFGLTDSSLDSGQLAILAALGLSRSR